MAFGWVTRRAAPAKSSTSRAFDLYVSASPDAQNAVDAVTGWKSSFPPRYDLKAGSSAAYNDPRIHWAIECFGSLAGRHVLELGPIEGAHTSMLEAAGAQVDAIEENQLAFARCLIAKEILGLVRARFWLGDFMKALEQQEQSYDMIVAFGILNHIDPLRFIELSAKRVEALYIWTHLLPEARSPRRTAERHRFHGRDLRVYRPAYAQTEGDAASHSGMNDQSWWLPRDDLIEALTVVGFKEIRMAHYEPTHPHGPALSLFARK